MYNFIRKCFMGMFCVLWVLIVIALTLGGAEAVITGSSNLLNNAVVGGLSLGVANGILWLVDAMITSQVD